MRFAGAIFLAAIVVALTPACDHLPLTIYFIDVEGGQSTLVVTPTRQTLLIDTGWAGDRDVKRILAAARDARIDRLDYLFITHFHPDHVGGAAEVGRRLPVGTFIDYGGELTEPDPATATVEAFEAYKLLKTGGRHVLARPGVRVQVADLDVDVLSGAGETLTTPLDGAGEDNPACAAFEPRRDDPSENSRSSGLRLRYGRFRFLDPGDLSWNKIVRLACPRNLVGQIDAYLVAHHGNGDTNVPALLAALKPRVAIVNNGPRKGGVPSALATLRHLDGLAALWQLHQSRFDGADNAPADFIANLDDGETGYWLKLTAQADGRFAIENSRNGYVQTY